MNFAFLPWQNHYNIHHMELDHKPKPTYSKMHMMQTYNTCAYKSIIDYIHWFSLYIYILLNSILNYIYYIYFCIRYHIWKKRFLTAGSIVLCASGIRCHGNVLSVWPRSWDLSSPPGPAVDQPWPGPVCCVFLTPKIEKDRKKQGEIKSTT